MATAPAPAAARELAGLLRAVHRRSTALPEAERRRAVELCLAYHLRGQEQTAAARTLRDVYREFGGDGQEESRPDPRRPGMGLSPETAKALQTVVAGLLGREEAARAGTAVEALPRAAEEWERVGERFAATRPTTPASACLSERVGELGERLSKVDQALELTAQEFLDRLLEAFDPEAAKAYVGEKGLKLSSFYKASVYDALSEKFSQLRAYHEKGRLVRDFRATFKRYLKQRDTTERGE